MSSRMRRAALTLHLTVSVGWIGALVAYLALDIAVATRTDDWTLRAGYVAMDVILREVILPLALTSLATGLVMSLGTAWGLFRHYWVAISFMLTVFAVAVLLLQLPRVSYIASIAANPSASRDGLRALGSTLPHSVGGTILLLLVLVLNVYKPPGLTPYGWRKLRPGRPDVPPSSRSV